MARKVRFPLNMNGEMVRTFEELQEHFHLESLLAYFYDGKLEQWVRDRYFDDKADAIAALDKSDSELSKKLCEILEVEYSAEADVDMEDIEHRNEKMKELRKYCDDKEVIENIANVALTQDDLYDLLDEGKDKIYLVHGKFEMPSKANVTYMGVADPEVKIVNADELEEKGIKLVNIYAKALFEQSKEETKDNHDFELVNEKDVITFGKYNDKPIEWLVVKKNKDSILVISKEILFKHKYAFEYSGIRKLLYEEDYTWENSGIRKLLNEDFYMNAFSDDEKSLIIEVASDKISLLWKEEAEELMSKSERAINNSWWLESIDDNYVWCVNDIGEFTVNYLESVQGVRPTMYIKLK